MILMSGKDSEPADTGSLDRQARFLLKKVNKALREYDLIGDGDRIVVAVSGGKDSMSLLRLLLIHRVMHRRQSELVAVHIAIEEAPGALERAEAVEAHCRELGVRFERVPLPMNEGESWPLSCQRCAWNRRKALFLTADRLGCNKVAMGHHQDDSAQTVLMNLIHQGQLEGIPAKRAFFGGIIEVIRPLILVPEKEIASFARLAGYPIGHVECPDSENSERAYVSHVLSEIEKRSPWVKANLCRAVERKGEGDGRGSRD